MKAKLHLQKLPMHETCEMRYEQELLDDVVDVVLDVVLDVGFRDCILKHQHHKAPPGVEEGSGYVTEGGSDMHEKHKVKLVALDLDKLKGKYSEPKILKQEPLSRVSWAAWTCLNWEREKDPVKGHRTCPET